MNRILYIFGIVLSLVFLGVSVVFLSFYIAARSSEVFTSNAEFQLASFTSESITIRAGWTLLCFLVYFIFMDILGIAKVKTKTMKVVGIISLVISVFVAVNTMGMLSSPGSMSYDEVVLVYMAYSFIVLTFSIIGLIQSIKYFRKLKVQEIPTERKENLLDS